MNKRLPESDAWRLDITSVVEPGTQGKLPPTFTLDWGNSVTREAVFSLAGQLVTEDGRPAYRLVWQWGEEQREQVVGLAEARSPLGKGRAGWVCPHCNKRAEVLFLDRFTFMGRLPLFQGWACAGCQRIIFDSQSTSSRWRSELRACFLKKNSGMTS